MNAQIEVELQDIYGSDRTVAESAWTSSITKLGRERRSDKDVTNVCRRIVSEGHGVPVESIHFRFWIRMPLMTDRQHMTHRIASHNGQSGRYRTMPSDFIGITQPVKAIFNKIGKGLFAEDYTYNCKISNNLYLEMVEALKEAELEGKIPNAELKLAREFVRGMLPQSNLVERTTEMNLRSLGNYFIHRLSGHASPEIREVAVKMYYAIKNHSKFTNIQHTWKAAESRYFVFTPDPDTTFMDNVFDDKTLEDFEINYEERPSVVEQVQS